MLFVDEGVSGRKPWTQPTGPQGWQHTCTNPIARSKILAVNETNGNPESWAPSVNSALGVFAYASGNAVFSDYLQINYVAGTGELAVLCGAVLGAGLTGVVIALADVPAGEQ